MRTYVLRVPCTWHQRSFLFHCPQHHLQPVRGRTVSVCAWHLCSSSGKWAHHGSSLPPNGMGDDGCSTLSLQRRRQSEKASPQRSHTGWVHLLIHEITELRKWRLLFPGTKEEMWAESNVWAMGGSWGFYRDGLFWSSLYRCRGVHTVVDVTIGGRLSKRYMASVLFLMLTCKPSYFQYKI